LRPERRCIDLVAVSAIAVETYKRLEANVMRHNFRVLQLIPENASPEQAAGNIR